MIDKKVQWAFFIAWAIFLLALTVCFTTYSFHKITSEREYNKALIEQFGKPQIIEQRYITPNDDK